MPMRTESTQMRKGGAVEEDHTSEQWEDWMDWSKTSENDTQQIASPQNSITPDPQLSASRKLKASGESRGSPISPGAGRRNSNGKAAQNKSHSIVEKRYRTNLNQRINELSNCVPILRGDDSRNGGGAESSSTLKHNKATVLAEAILYIKQLERRNSYLEQASLVLQEQSQKEATGPVVADEEVKADGNRPTSSSTTLPDSSGPSQLDAEEHHQGSQPAEAERAPPKPAQGIIKVPEEWRRMWKGELKAYCPDSRHAANAGEKESSGTIKVPGSKYVGRLMVGSLAGIMLMDGFAVRQQESKGDRGLSSIPVLRHVAQNFSTFPNSNLLLSFAKGFLMFGLLGLLLFIYLFNSEPPSRRKPTSTPTPQPAPSIASPLEVRQRAFLTAIQTIWFPRHHALPEMLALTVETAAYIVRQLLGWQTYSWLTGRTEDEEIARVRAWDIAIDAQLSGGDPEISKSRLVLSLWASGTLPSSPARLMLKALHIRILFWQPSNWAWLTRKLHQIACKLARWQWNRAYRLQETLDQAKSLKPDTDHEPLTSHLRSLLAQPSEAVMTDEIIQRAHNLAWNTAAMRPNYSEGVYEDNAMRGPLDALASWFSDDILIGGLNAMIQKGLHDKTINDRVDVFIPSAPPGSLSNARVLAAKALIDGNNRTALLRELLQQMAPTALSGNDLTKEKLLATLHSLVAELPESDAQDIAVCASIAIILDQMRSYGEDQNLATCMDQIFQPGNESLGLLGWAAIHRITAFAPCDASSDKLQDILRSVLDALDASDGLNITTKTTLGDHFRAMLQKRLSITQAAKRRSSESSIDTGYASLSDG